MTSLDPIRSFASSASRPGHSHLLPLPRLAITSRKQSGRRGKRLELDAARESRIDKTMSTPRKHPSSSDAAVLIQPSSPRYTPSGTPTAGAHRKIGIAVDLSDESAYAVRWAVQNYLRPGDAVILVHVSPTSVLYGADWGSIDLSLHDGAVGVDTEESHKRTLEEEFDAFTTAKANDLAQPLVDAQIPFKIHIVKDHDMKERLCLEVERLGLNAVVMGSRGFGAVRKNDKGRLGSVSDYCVHHCVLPVIVVRFPSDKDKDGGGSDKLGSPATRGSRRGSYSVLPEEEPEYHDASDKQSEMDKAA